MSDYNNLIEKLNGLSLDGFTQILPNIIDKLQNNEIDFYEALNELVNNQIKVKKEKVYKAGIKVSHFPFIKTLNDFDFSFQPSINRAQIKDFTTLRFMVSNENTINVINNERSQCYIWMINSSKHDVPILLYFFKESRKHKNAL